MKKCTISQIFYDTSSLRPVLLNFQNGTLQPNSEDKLYTRIYSNPEGKTIIAVASENMLYTGEINRKNDLYNTFIGETDKETKRMKLIATDTVTLSPCFIKPQEELNKSPINKSTIIDLNKTFGSKRTKRQTEQRERLKIDVEKVKDHLQENVADVNIDENDIVAPAFDESKSTYKPPINRDATAIGEVYVLYDLIPKEILHSMKQKVKEIFETDEYKFNSVFVQKKFRQLQNASQTAKDERYRILLCIDILIKFLSAPIKSIGKNFDICDYSKLLSDYIVENFTLPSGKKSNRLRPISMRDKILCYVLVLAMMASDYQINLGDLTHDLKIGVKKLHEISRVLAFSTPNSKDKNSMILKLPLPAVVVRQSNKRKRK